MTDLKHAQKERPAFVGKVRFSLINDRKEMNHASVKKLHQKMAIGGLALLIFVLISVATTILCLRLKYYLVVIYKISHGSLIAGVVNAGQIAFLNEIYRYVAKQINVWENHRTQREYEDALILKTFIFRFFNSYASFFYIAFIKKPLEGNCLQKSDLDEKGNVQYMDCMEELEIQIMSIFATQLIVMNASEALKPWFKMKLRIWKEKLNTLNFDDYEDTYEQPELELKYEPYEEKEAFDDYSELVVQYGFVILFVVAFPLTPFLALVNNMAECHIDAYKLCYDTRRPAPHMADSIGMWEYFLNVISKISVATNIALIIFVSGMFDQPPCQLSIAWKWGVFITCEHLLLITKGVIEDLVPDVAPGLAALKQRHEWLVGKILHGDADDHCESSEVSEDIDLTIHPNSSKLGQKKRPTGCGVHDINGHTTTGANSTVMPLYTQKRYASSQKFVV